MRRAAALAAAALALAFVDSCPAAADEDDPCARLHAFYEAPFEKDAHFRSIQFYWTGVWLDFSTGWGVKCDSSQDAAAKELCAWLPGHTSVEFISNLPKRVLECAPGISLAQDGVHIDLTYATASIYPSASRYVRLLIDFRPRKTGSGGIQLTAFEITPTRGYDEATETIPQLFGPDNPLAEP